MDTCVLVTGLRSKRGASFRMLELVGDPRWQLHLSTALLLQYESVSKREAANFWLQPQRIEDVLDFLCENAREAEISFTWRPTLSDPDDELVLELAVAAGADFIVTHNLRDFHAAETFGILSITPLQFLRKIGENPSKPSRQICPIRSTNKRRNWRKRKTCPSNNLSLWR